MEEFLRLLWLLILRVVVVKLLLLRCRLLWLYGIIVMRLRRILTCKVMLLYGWVMLKMLVKFRCLLRILLTLVNRNDRVKLRWTMNLLLLIVCWLVMRRMRFVTRLTLLLPWLFRGYLNRVTCLKLWKVLMWLVNCMCRRRLKRKIISRLVTWLTLLVNVVLVLLMCLHLSVRVRRKLLVMYPLVTLTGTKMRTLNPRR